MFPQRIDEPSSESPAPRTADERDLERVAIALSMCTYPRRLPSRMAAEEVRSLTDRARLAINTGDADALDTALTDATMALANQHPHMVRDLVLAEAFAKTVIATWITSMSAQTAGR